MVKKKVINSLLRNMIFNILVFVFILEIFFVDFDIYYM